MVLEAIKTVASEPWDYMINLSEADFLVKPLSQLEAIFAESVPLLAL